MSGSGGVSVRAGPSPRHEGRRSQLRREQRRQLRRVQGGEPEAAAVDGALLCIDCGQLAWPASPAATPHRHDESTALARQPACTHCDHRSWIELGRDSAALALREDEELRADVRRRGARPMVARGMVGLVVGATLGLSFIGTLWGVAVVGGLAGLVAGLSNYRTATLHRGPPPTLPVRWSMALPPDAQQLEVRAGAARAVGDLLTAPLTGRRCVAYEVGVRHDDDRDAPLGTWALLEQRITAVEVDGRPVDPQTTHLQLPRARLGSTAEVELDDAARGYLQRRGLALAGSTFELYESVLEADERVELCVRADGEAGAALRCEAKHPVRVDGDRAPRVE